MDDSWIGLRGVIFRDNLSFRDFLDRHALYSNFAVAGNQTGVELIHTNKNTEQLPESFMTGSFVWLSTRRAKDAMLYPFDPSLEAEFRYLFAGDKQ